MRLTETISNMTTKVAERATPKRGRPVKKISTVLINAKAILEERGFTKGCLMNRRGRVCSLGALAIACGFEVAPGLFTVPTIEGQSTFGRASDALGAAMGAWPPYFNDASHTTRKKVLAKFDEAIVLAKRAERRQPAVKVSA